MICGQTEHIFYAAPFGLGTIYVGKKRLTELQPQTTARWLLPRINLARGGLGVAPHRAGTGGSKKARPESLQKQDMNNVCAS